jgi:hypothetical protein
MELQVGDRLADETGEWKVTVRPYTSPGGRNVHARVRRVDQPATAEDPDLGRARTDRGEAGMIRQLEGLGKEETP